MAFCIFFSGCGLLHGEKKEVEFEPVQHRAYYSCPRKMTSVVIDGKLDEVAWQYAAPVREFSIAPEHRPPTNPTLGLLTWDDRYLYVAFDAIDPAIEATRTGRDSDTYKDDVLEIFFKTDPDEWDYHNVEVNALGAFRDGYHTPERRFNAAWNCPGLEVGVHVEGTLNDPTDEDEGWQLEVAIPFACLPTLEGRAPEPGDVWLFHLSRIDRSPRLEEGRELISTAPMEEPRFHSAEKWLPLVFAGPRTSRNDETR
jgi:hypothetical protein